ncbi:hypothetical protein LINPERPRIM_LOCUS39604 [Linum perenne]
MLNLKLHCKRRYAHAQASKVQNKNKQKRKMIFLDESGRFIQRR